MMDWEMKAKGLAHDAQVMAVILGGIAAVNAWDASGWDFAWWLLVAWLALSGYVDARIEP